MDNLPEPLDTVGSMWKKQARQFNMFVNTIVFGGIGMALLVIILIGGRL